jgi:hypothetical protein
LVFAWLLFATLPDGVRVVLRFADLHLSGPVRLEIAVAAAVPIVFAGPRSSGYCWQRWLRAP